MRASPLSCSRMRPPVCPSPSGGCVIAGTVPGYTGWRPEAAHVKNVSAWGCVPHERGGGYVTPDVGLSASLGSLADQSKPPDHTEQGVRQYDWRRKNKQAEPPPSFRDNVGGVLPGYAGHVPRADEKHGTSHYGGLAPEKMYVPLAQTGHEVREELMKNCPRFSTHAHTCSVTHTHTHTHMHMHTRSARAGRMRAHLGTMSARAHATPPSTHASDRL